MGHKGKNTAKKRIAAARERVAKQAGVSVSELNIVKSKGGTPIKKAKNTIGGSEVQKAENKRREIVSQKAEAAKSKSSPRPTTTSNEKQAQDIKKAFEEEKKREEEKKAAKITLTTEQAKRIKEGTLKATQETTAAVLEGNVNIQDPTIKDAITSISGSEALAIFPLGKGLRITQKIGVAASNIKISSILKAGYAKSPTPVGKLTTISKGIPAPIQSNTKTEKLTRGLFDKILNKEVKKTIKTTNPKTGEVIERIVTSEEKRTVGIIAGTALVAALGTYPWAAHLRGDNVMGGLSIIKRDAIKEGNQEAADMAQAAIDLLLDPSVEEQILRAIPGVNVINEVKNIFEVARLTDTIWNKINEDEKIAEENGETEDQKWARIKEEEKAADKAAVDYYNTERKKMIRFENEARKDAAKATRRDEVKARNDDAAFWAAEAAKQRELEAEDRKAIADFWIAYRKTVNQIQNTNRPSNLNFSNLNFGLL